MQQMASRAPTSATSSWCGKAWQRSPAKQLRKGTGMKQKRMIRKTAPLITPCDSGTGCLEGLFRSAPHSRAARKCSRKAGIRRIVAQQPSAEPPRLISSGTTGSFPIAPPPPPPWSIGGGSAGPSASLWRRAGARRAASVLRLGGGVGLSPAQPSARPPAPSRRRCAPPSWAVTGGGRARLPCSSAPAPGRRRRRRRRRARCPRWLRTPGHASRGRPVSGGRAMEEEAAAAAAAEPGWGWAALVLLFAASLLTVSAWLLQLGRSLWRGRAAGAPRSQAAPAPAGLWAAMLRLGSGREGAGSCATSGARGLLASLFAFRAFRENWQRAWLRALNDQARQHGSSVQITFEESPRQLPAVTISHVACTDQSDRRMVLHCLLSTDTLQFPVLVAQQSPAAVSMDTYCVSLAVQQAQLEISLEEVEGEGLLVSWAFKDRPDLKLSIPPRLQPHRENDGKADLSIIKNLIEDSIISTQPAMMVNLKACITNASTETSSRLSLGSLSSSAPALMPKLLLQHLRALHLAPQESQGNGLLCCEVQLDSPRQQKRMGPVPAGPATEVEWPGKLLLELGPRSKELVLRVLEGSHSGEDVLLGFVAVPVDPSSKEPQGQQLYQLSPGPARALPPAAAIAVELLHQDTPELQAASSLRTSITPTKKVEMGRTIMPDGTIVTTVTTVQSRPKLDCKLDSPSRSPSKVEVTEKVTTMLPENGCPSRASPCSSRSSCVSNGLDPVAETAIRQLTDLTNKPAKKTPTKRSTLIISGVSKVPIAQDEMALSLGYAGSLGNSLQEDSIMAGLSEYAPLSTCETTQQLEMASQDLDEATHSDISERPSVDDVESETGSTGALETRSLKDHKVGFLRSGTKLIFRRKNKQKEAGLSQSHDDLPNASTASAPRKKSGSFSRRLIKRFSFKGRAKSKSNGSSPPSVEKP